LLAAAVAADNLYACMGYSFRLPIEFTGAESEPTEGYALYYPDAGPDMAFKIVLDRLPVDQSSTKAEFFNNAYKSHVSRNSWSITGKTRTILGRSVSEAGGPVTYGQHTGRALAYLVPAPNGDQLFIAIISVEQSGANQLDAIAALMTSTFKADPTVK